MENPTTEQATAEVYEPPMLVQMGEFSEDTLGGPGLTQPDAHWVYD